MNAASLALAGGSLIFLGFLALFFVALVWGYYTKSGSDIALRPSDGAGRNQEEAAPGAEGPGRIAGREAGEQERFDTHGTR